MNIKNEMKLISNVSMIIKMICVIIKWDEVFKDPILTAALVDRLTHKAYVINMNGNSYRTKETLEILKE
ncbi:MAG: ATP-binding protein [Chlamydiia bacterium]|nr:ATP-binding protein [Chlamydiia bacterium]